MAGPGVVLAFAGVGLCVIAVAGASWSVWRLRGTSAGAALSAASGAVAIIGAVLVVVGAVIPHG